MANIDSSTLNKNDFMQAYGDGDTIEGQVALAAAPLAADVIRVMKIPAGNKVSAVLVGNGQLDSNGTPLFTTSMGYAPVVAADGPAASPAYFKAAGDTTLRSAQDGKVYCNFAPITFEKDVYLTITVGAAPATFAAASINVVALAQARGIK